MAEVQVLHRGRFYEIGGATASRVAANVWRIEVPVADAIHKRTRRTPSVEGWDGAVFLIDDVETEPAVGSEEGPDFVAVTAVILPSR